MRTSYVIKSWEANNTPIDGQDTYIRIVGRAGGLLSWLLTLIKVSPLVTLTVTSDKLKLEQGSLAGSQTAVMSLRRISSTHYGYHKPWVEAAILGAVTLVPTFGIGLIIAVVYYFLAKSYSVSVRDFGGEEYGISFRRSVIEGIAADETQAQYVSEIIQWLVDTRETGSK